MSFVEKKIKDVVADNFYFFADRLETDPAGMTAARILNNAGIAVTLFGQQRKVPI